MRNDFKHSRSEKKNVSIGFLIGWPAKLLRWIEGVCECVCVCARVAMAAIETELPLIAIQTITINDDKWPEFNQSWAQ